MTGAWAEASLAQTRADPATATRRPALNALIMVPRNGDCTKRRVRPDSPLTVDSRRSLHLHLSRKVPTTVNHGTEVLLHDEDFTIRPRFDCLKLEFFSEPRFLERRRQATTRFRSPAQPRNPDTARQDVAPDRLGFAAAPSSDEAVLRRPADQRPARPAQQPGAGAVFARLDHGAARGRGGGGALVVDLAAALMDHEGPVVHRRRP
ncbi:hypothetical protein ACMZ4W_02242 [Brevundimonas naejangsanensis]